LPLPAALLICSSSGAQNLMTGPIRNVLKLPKLVLALNRQMPPAAFSMAQEFLRLAPPLDSAGSSV
jgi:hypothetical protein